MRNVLASSLLIILLTGAAPRAAERPAGLIHGEALALARLLEARSISRRLDRNIWPGFKAEDFPAVIFQPGGWAIAVGFPEAPGGFEPIPGTLDAERQVYRVIDPGGFDDPGRSPAVVAGRWSVISRFEPPPVIPERGYMGRAGAEEPIARFLGDAFMIHLMRKRGLETPYPSGIPLYPDSAELTALTAVEQRLLLRSAKMVNLNESNYDEFLETARQIVAVHRERWRLMGPETAALEVAVENSYGLGALVEQSIHRMAIRGGFVSRPIFQDDPTYQEHENSLLLRLLRTNYSMSRTPDNPAATVDQIAARARVIGFLLNRIHGRLGWKGLDGTWRPHALQGKEALIEILARGDESKEIDEAEMLAQAKQKQGYLALLRLAKEDLVRLIRDRERVIEDLFPAGSWLEVRFGEEKVLLQNDISATIHLGKGRSLHDGWLSIRTAGLELTLDEYPSPARHHVLSFLDLEDRRPERLRIRLPQDGLPQAPPEPSRDRPFLVEGPGLRLEARTGRLSKAGNGSWVLSLE